MICASDALVDGGEGVRFTLTCVTGEEPAFVVRYHGRVHAFINRCAHVPVQLDWQSGRFFDATGLYLICATHGATYEPDTGRCVAGPCRGGRLRPIAVLERDGGIFLAE